MGDCFKICGLLRKPELYKSTPDIYTLSLAPNGKKAKEATEVAVTASVEASPNKNNIQDQTSLNKKKLSISTITNTTTSTTTNNSTSVISTSDENNPKQTGLTILERPKRISFCKDPIITNLDINSKTNTMSTFVNQSTQPSVSLIILQFCAQLIFEKEYKKSENI